MPALLCGSIIAPPPTLTFRQARPAGVDRRSGRARPTRRGQVSAFSRHFHAPSGESPTLSRRGKPRLASGEGRRTAGPALEGMMKRGRAFIAKKPSDLRQREARLVEILCGEAAPQAVDDLGEIRAFLSEPPRKRSRAQRQRLGDDLRSSASVWQQGGAGKCPGRPRRDRRDEAAAWGPCCAGAGPQWRF